MKFCCFFGREEGVCVEGEGVGEGATEANSEFAIPCLGKS